MLASYDLHTPSTVSAVGMSAALGHMSLPNLAGVVIHSTEAGYDGLVYICGVGNVLGFALPRLSCSTCSRISSRTWIACKAEHAYARYAG